MKYKLSYLVFFLMVLCCNQLHSQNQDSIYMRSICDSVMKNFLDGEYLKAMERIKAHSGLGETLIQLQTTVPITMSKAISHYGRSVSYQFISERHLVNAVKEFFYLLMFEKYFLKFDFTWYKGTSGWMIVNFNFNENLTDVLN